MPPDEQRMQVKELSCLKEVAVCIDRRRQGSVSHVHLCGHCEVLEADCHCRQFHASPATCQIIDALKCLVAAQTDIAGQAVG